MGVISSVRILNADTVFHLVFASAKFAARVYY